MQIIELFLFEHDIKQAVELLLLDESSLSASDIGLIETDLHLCVAIDGGTWMCHSIGASLQLIPPLLPVVPRKH